MGSKGLTGNNLKIIAFILMIIDNAAAVLLAAYLNSGDNNAFVIALVMARIVGRLAFPLFAFLITEGFIHTSDFKKYILRMGIFAVLSELPRDLALSGKLLEFDTQNVLFTWVIALGTLFFIKQYEDKAAVLKASPEAEDTTSDRIRDKNEMKAMFAKLGIALGGAIVAFFLKVDYSAPGVLCVALMYIYRADKLIMTVWGNAPLVFLSRDSLIGLLSYPFIKKYNGSRGSGINKYVFYVLYPVHLLVIYALSVFMK